MLLVDKEIRDLCLSAAYFKQKPMISPFSEAVQGDGVISYGLTAAGYDIRLGPEVLVFNNTYGEQVDPKRFKDNGYQGRVFTEITFTEQQLKANQNKVIIPAHGYILGRSLEYLYIPRELKARCTGKSTYARSGIIVNVTPLEPEWEGHLTIEISNSCCCPAVVYVGEGIAQLEFEQLSDVVETSYKDKSGKYMEQTGVTVAKVL